MKAGMGFDLFCNYHGKCSGIVVLVTELRDLMADNGEVDW